MKNFPTQVTGGGGDEGVLTAQDANSLMGEGKNLVESSGQTLSTADSEQSAKAVALYLARADYYVCTGPANAYTLTAQGQFKAPQAYALGQRVRFQASASNTGPATVNANGVGVVSLLDRSGAALASGALVAGLVYEAVYDGAAFRLTNGAATEEAAGPIELATASEAIALVDEGRAVTPATLKSVLDQPVPRKGDTYHSDESIASAAAAAARPLTAADHGVLFLLSNETFTVTLPAAASVPDGFRIGFLKPSAAGVQTVAPSGADTINFQAASMALSRSNQKIELIRTTGSNWQALQMPATDVLPGHTRHATPAEALAGTLGDVAVTPAGLLGSLGDAGDGLNNWARFPVNVGGVRETRLIQWGQVGVSGGLATVTFEKSYLSAPTVLVSDYVITLPASIYTVASAEATTLGFKVSASGDGAVVWFAIGRG